MLLTRDPEVFRERLGDLVQLGLCFVGDAPAVVVDPPGPVVLLGALFVLCATEAVCTGIETQG